MAELLILVILETRPRLKYCLFLTGIEAADFVFYISAMETERCQKGMTVAYAAHCQQESALDRSVVNNYEI